MGKSILEAVKAHVKDGKLQEGFSLAKGPFADGAQDGIFMYHMNHESASPEKVESLRAVLKKALTGNYKKADEMYLNLKTQTLSVIDDIQDIVFEMGEGDRGAKIWDYAAHLIEDGEDPELVKLGLALAEPFDTDDDDVYKEELRTLGLSNELSLFVIFNMRKWTDANEEIFALVKKVTGWGRIFGINFLSEGLTDEIKTWLITDGWSNYVMTEYSVLDIWNQAGAEERLKSETITTAELKGIGRLIEASIGDGKPMATLSNLENFEEIKSLWISKAKAASDAELDELIKNVG